MEAMGAKTATEGDKKLVEIAHILKQTKAAVLKSEPDLAELREQ